MVCAQPAVLTTRLATANDVRPISDICQISFAKQFSYLWQPEMLRQYLQTNYAPEVLRAALNIPHHQIWVAIDSHQTVLGSVKLKCHSAHEQLLVKEGVMAIELEKMYVHPDAQGQGVGKSLMQAVLAEVGNYPDPVLLWLLVHPENERAKAMYHRFGFKPHEVVPWQFRAQSLEFLLMSKDI